MRALMKRTGFVGLHLSCEIITTTIFVPQVSAEQHRHLPFVVMTPVRIAVHKFATALALRVAPGRP
jgi:hypothetical protein